MSALAKIENALKSAKSLKEAMTLDFVQDRFIKNYEAVTGRKDGENKFQSEVFALLELCEDKPDLKNVDRFYHFAALVKVATTGLSLRDNKLYVIPSGKGLKVQSSPAGKREQFEMMKEVKRVPESQLVMKGDKFVHDKLNNVIKEHTTTDKSATVLSLDNIQAAYTRIYWNDRKTYAPEGTITDVVVYHDELVKAKSKSKSQSEQGFWAQWPGEACKKVSMNRAFRLYHKYPDNIVTFGADGDKEVEDTKDTEYAEVDDAPFVSTETVDESTGEVTIEQKTKKKETSDEPFV